MSTHSPNTETFLRAMAGSRLEAEPRRYWVLSDVLADSVCERIVKLPIEAPQFDHYDGARDSNNDSRVFFNAEKCDRFPICREIVETFKERDAIRAIEDTCGIDLSNGRLRIEYVQDRDGFWLKPHVDINEKLFTLQVYLLEDRTPRDAGTDIFDDSGEHAKTVPCHHNHGFMLVPSDGTWHGFMRRPVVGVRRSIIVNFVNGEWRALHELAP